MSEFKKALKQWDKEKESFSDYLSSQTEESVIKLKDELERALIHGQPLALDMFTAMASKPYDKSVLKEVLSLVEEEIKRRNVFYLKKIQEYIQEALPIAQEGQHRVLTTDEKRRLTVTLKMASDYANLYKN